jgi:hypothetical protein
MGPRSLLAAVLGGLVVFPFAPMQAQAPAPLDISGAMQCEVRGFAIDRDPKGTNVRSTPSSNAPIIGHLVPMIRIGGDEYSGVEFDIVAFKGAWFLIKNGSDDGLKLDAAHKDDGRGWISARLVGVQLRVPAFRSAPRRDAPEVAHLMGDNWGPDSVSVSAVHGCQGPYIEVTTTPIGGKPIRGWSYKPCSLQLTTCDGRLVEP